MLIDTHCHLDAPEFTSDLEAVVAEASCNGVHAWVVPGVSSDHFPAIESLCQRFPGCAPAWGIHPLYVEKAVPEDIERVAERLAPPSPLVPVALGEIGLDLYVEDRFFERQERFFVEQLRLARKYQLPVILHTRRAVDQVLKALRRIPVPGGIAHAFNGSAQQAQQFIDLGFKLGYGGAMTFEGSRRIRHLAATLPLSALVLETDAPDIPPVWARGARNDPNSLPRFAQILADLRAISVEEVIETTGQNAQEALPALSGYLRQR